MHTKFLTFDNKKLTNVFDLTNDEYNKIYKAIEISELYLNSPFFNTLKKMKNLRYISFNISNYESHFNSDFDVKKYINDEFADFHYLSYILFINYNIMDAWVAPKSKFIKNNKMTLINPSNTDFLLYLNLLNT